MTRREVLMELKRIGVTEPHLLKRYCRDFENYINASYSYKILKKERQAPQSADRQRIGLRNK